MNSQFSDILIQWYHVNARNLPWRNTREPYKIWLSEIILQQTRVEQGTPYYFSFIENFPELRDLALADEERVMKAWQGLGYYSRARNLHQTAKTILNEHHGNFPNSFNELLKLKGIGPYTAAAIASFSFDEAVPVVDGNVYRFVSRYFGIEMEIGTPKAMQHFSSLLSELMPANQAAVFNQAIMEFGSLQCTPRLPHCANCPFQSSCYAFEHKQIDVFPHKKKKVKVLPVYFHFADIRHQSKTWLTQRDDGGLWKKLWHYPMIESTADTPESEILDRMMQAFGLDPEHCRVKESWTSIHLLSHRKIYARFWHLETSLAPEKNDIFEIEASELENYALPKLMSKYLNAKKDVSK